MSQQNDIVMRAILAHLDMHPRAQTTCAVRLRCLKNVCEKLPKDVCHRLRDFNRVYVVLRRVLQDPDKSRVSPNNGARIDSDMQRLFVEGSRLFRPTYLASIEYMYHQNPSSEKIGRAPVRQERPAKIHAGRRKAASSGPAENQDPSTAKISRLNTTRPSRQSLQSHRNSALSLDVEIPPETLRASVTLPLASLATVPPTPRSTAVNSVGLQIERDFVAIDEIVEKVLFSVEDWARFRIVQLKTNPTPELSKLYKYAFGAVDWKPIAITLQSNHALVAGFLQCIIWSFLVLNIFDPHGPIRDLEDLLSGNSSSVFLRTVLEDMGVDYGTVVRDAFSRRLGDRNLAETVTEPRTRFLARQLMLVLEEAHFEGPTAGLTQWAIELCATALQLRGRLDSVKRKFFIKRYSNGGHDRYVEADMNRMLGNIGGMVAFTITPGLWEVREEGEALIRKATVRTTLDLRVS